MSLLVNFANHQLGCTIYCDHPSFSDDYALTNIISDNPILKSRGFLATQFTKPPLDILISLPYAIEVERIGILAKTGTCISQSISIYVSDQSMEDLVKNTNQLMTAQSRSRTVAMLDVATPHNLMAPRGKNNDLSKERYPGDLMMSGGTLYNTNSNTNQSSNTNALYSQLLYRNFTLMSTMENLHQLDHLYSYKCNTHFDYRQQIENTSFYPLPPQLNEQIKQINQLQSFHSNINLLKNVKTIRIRILNVFQSSCPALGGVEIWGLPSRHLTPDIVNQIYHKNTITVQQQMQIRQQQQQQPQQFSFNNLLNSSICISSPLPNHFSSDQQQQYQQQQQQQQQQVQQQSLSSTTFSIPIPTNNNNNNHVNPQPQQPGNTFSIGTNHSNSHSHSHHHHHHHHHHNNHNNHNGHNNHNNHNNGHNGHTTPNNTPRRTISSSMEMESDNGSSNGDFEQFLASHPEIILDEAGVPTIFIDPITTKMMEDPVVLPSGKIVDRTTMEKLFQNQYHTDPFSGVRITTADIKPDNVLKLQIQSFINEKKKRKRILKNALPTLVASSSSIDPFTTTASSVASSTCSSLNSSLSGTNGFLVNSSGGFQLQQGGTSGFEMSMNDNFLTDHHHQSNESNNGGLIINGEGHRKNSNCIYPLSRLLSQTSLSELPVKKIKK
ncbi:RING zinc finger-containing protein [Cavenderia fasciculata]|uniref:RING zinc finger-containing protein n=1 Tax=Cavenderia fasciculata TaxID=261658 RepID=F4QDP3_CACFS|nr:RING zinc finger-containing protein [Cavenderia fasciculata]EGG13840.1 RING zinc finger-containing protein [Cavenderia fasciculata]|eukprot:XP_004350548.1 RING zinc finger-containing protein [Cavenderia fasciculata]